jgi:hypothetical protein
LFGVRLRQERKDGFFLFPRDFCPGTCHYLPSTANASGTPSANDRHGRFDTTQFLPFPSKNADISTYPAWAGIQNLPGYNYKPAAGDTIKNGVYQDFGTYVRTIPTRWGDVRVSNVNEANIGLYKNVRFTERIKMQLRFDAFNALNHPRFPGPDTNPGNSTFGRVQKSQQNQARAIELGARLSF